MKLLTRIKNIFLLNLFIGINLVQAQSYQHLIIYGQSLSTGQQSWPPISTENVTGNFMIGNQVWINNGNSQLKSLTPLIANVSNRTKSLPKTKSSQAEAECPIVGMTNHIQLQTNGKYNFIASSCGAGGRTIEELSKEHYYPINYRDFTNTLNYTYSLTSDINCPAIIWMQGEYNYSQMNRGLTQGSPNVTDKTGYKQLLLKLKNNMQDDIKAKYKQENNPIFITYQTGAQYTRGKEINIGMAQLEASNENDDIICAGPVYQMTDRGGHLDPNGYRWYGEMLAKVYYKTVVQGEKFKPLQPIEIYRTSNPKEIRVKFHVPYPPLVIDKLLVPYSSSGAGFQVYLNGSQTPENISIDVNSDEVIITGTRDFAGNLEIAYGATNTSGNGNLRDSDPYQAKYNYIDLDKKDAIGNYIFERDATETTLRPYFEPKDVDGIIYDKPYPLYNFCVAFYYTLGASQDKYVVPNMSTTDFKNIHSENTYKISLDSNKLEIDEATPEIISIQIIRASGETINKFSGKNRKIRFKKIPPGIYIVSLNTVSQNFISKHIVK